MKKQNIISIAIRHLLEASQIVAPPTIEVSPKEAAAHHLLVKDDPTKFIRVGINVPEDIFGYQRLHGTSVYATGTAALILTRKTLVDAGVPPSEVALLTSQYVTLEKITLPFVLEFKYPKTAQKVAMQLRSQVKRVGLIIRHAPEHHGVAYCGTLPQENQPVPSPADPDDAYAVNEISIVVPTQPQDHMLRFGLVLPKAILKQRGWHRLETWRMAHSENLYGLIFREFFRGLLRLDIPVHFEKPNAEAMAKLSQQAAKVLNDYFVGKDLKVDSDFAVGRPKSKVGRSFNSYRLQILDITGFDIAIPWAKQQTLMPKELWEQLMYQGDYAPPDARGSGNFCKSEWPKLLRQLNDGPLPSIGTSC
ncbi:MAG: hypothetical protein PSV24_07080 [Rhodoferax sp.]|nr:hypothetical protein [Rhodoferax sp.]